MAEIPTKISLETVLSDTVIRHHTRIAVHVGRAGVQNSTAPWPSELRPADGRGASAIEMATAICDEIEALADKEPTI